MGSTSACAEPPCTGPSRTSPLQCSLATRHQGPTTLRAGRVRVPSPTSAPSSVALTAPRAPSWTLSWGQRRCSQPGKPCEMFSNLLQAGALFSLPVALPNPCKPLGSGTSAGSMGGDSAGQGHGPAGSSEWQALQGLSPSHHAQGAQCSTCPWGSTLRPSPKQLCHPQRPGGLAE